MADGLRKALILNKPNAFNSYYIVLDTIELPLQRIKGAAEMRIFDTLFALSSYSSLSTAAMPSSETYANVA